MDPETTSVVATLEHLNEENVLDVSTTTVGMSSSVSSKCQIGKARRRRRSPSASGDDAEHCSRIPEAVPTSEVWDTSSNSFSVTGTAKVVVANPLPESSCHLNSPTDDGAMFVVTVDTQKRNTGASLDVGRLAQREEHLSASSVPRSPVQDWVDSIDVSDRRIEADHVEEVSVTSQDTEDALKLGDEAQHLHKTDDDSASVFTADGRMSEIVSQQVSRSRLSATSSVSSVEALLETMRDDPEEVLLNLGFGSPVASPLARIPSRFLFPSKVQGNDLNDFLQQHEEMQEMCDVAFSGYRGLSGYRKDGRSPSSIVSKMLEKLRERNRELKRTLQSPTRANEQSASLLFFRVANSVLAANAFRRLPSVRASILDPRNRAFLDSQGKQSTTRRSIILSDGIANKDSLWNVVKRTKSITSGQQCHNGEVPIVFHEVAIKGEKLNELEPEASCKKTSRLQRQLSVHDESAAPDLELPMTLHYQQKRDLVKWSANKESFELEELAGPAGDPQDEELPGGYVGKLQLDCGDMTRTSSAMSDSSGFLDGETLEAAMDMSEEAIPLPTSVQACDEVITDRPVTPRTTAEEDLPQASDHTAAETSDRSTKDDDAESSFDGNVASVGSPEYHSESETIVAVESTSSGDTASVGLCHESSSTDYERLPLEEKDDGARQELSFLGAKSRSENDLAHSRGLFGQHLRTSLESLPVRQKTECRVGHKTTESPSSRLRHIQEFRDKCTLTMAKMKDVIREYTKELMEMERSSWELYHQYFPSMTLEERDELRRLFELRIRIMEEANRTRLLLSAPQEEQQQQSFGRVFQSRRDNNPHLVKVAERLEMLIECQQNVHDYLVGVQSRHVGLQSRAHLAANVPAVFSQLKSEVMGEVRSLLRSDHDKFQEELQSTRRGIEEVRSIVTTLLSAVQSSKSNT